MSENKPTLPAWDLSDMYKGIDDPQIAADMESYRKTAASFARKYKGRLAGLSAEEFARALEIYNKLSEMAGLLGGFAYLNMCTQMKNKEAMAFFQNTSEKLTDYGKPVIFFELELNRLPAATLKEWLKNKKVAFYKPFIMRAQRFKKYDLPEAVEEVFVEKSVTSSEAWVRFYEETSSRLEYTVDGQKYNDAEITSCCWIKMLKFVKKPDGKSAASAAKMHRL